MIQTMTPSGAQAATADIRDVSYRYPDAEALSIDRCTWRIGQGEFLLVAGRSGSGKSTLLRTLNGLVPHFSGGHFAGTVAVKGRSTHAHGPNQMSGHVGFVFQDPESQLLASKVDEDIAFSLEQRGMAISTIRKRVEELLDLLSISHLRHRDPATLSSGERQRVAIAGAMALHPDLLVLDEPTSQLDPWGGEDVLTSLSHLNEDLGLTIVLAEHRMERLLHRVDGVRWVEAGASADEVVPPQAFVQVANPRVLPAVARLGLGLGWNPVPLTVKDGRKQAAATSVSPSGKPPISRSHLGEVVLSCQGVQAEHDCDTVLEDVYLDVKQGEIAALMGRNGSGKTTLLRTISGHHVATRGEIHIGERSIKDMVPSEIGRIVGYLPHQPASMVFAERVVDELRYTARQRGVSIDVSSLLDRFGLGGQENQHPRDLSGGEQERLALAIMLIGEPKALLLDEPTRGMDAWRKADLVSMLRAYCDRGGAVLLATHDVELVAEAADRVVMLGDRSVIAHGATTSVLGGSLTYTTQTQLVFGDQWLTPNSVISAMAGSTTDIDV